MVDETSIGREVLANGASVDVTSVLAGVVLVIFTGGTDVVVGFSVVG